MAEAMPIQCAKCAVLLQPQLDHPGKTLACPKCGEQDTFENVMTEIGDYITQEMAYRREANLKVRSTRLEPPKVTRFKVDLGSPDIG